MEGELRNVRCTTADVTYSSFSSDVTDVGICNTSQLMFIRVSRDFTSSQNLLPEWREVSVYVFQICVKQFTCNLNQQLLRKFASSSALEAEIHRQLELPEESSLLSEHQFATLTITDNR